VPTLKAFFNAVRPIVTLGASTNASCRQEIRDVVGKLSKDDTELFQYLSQVDSKLMSSFLEHHICAGLYHLADRFDQVFDPTRFSVSVHSYREIPELISHLKNGERAVLDDLDEMARQLKDYASRLRSASPTETDGVKQEIFNAIDYHRHELEKHRKTVKRLRRKIVDSL